MSRQHRSVFPPRTIPALAHPPVGGIEISVSENDCSTALKSIRSFEENAPMTFSQTAITGYNPFVAHLISSIILIAWKNSPDLLPASPSRFPILERFWQGEPNVIMWTGEMFPPCIFVISPKCSMSGKWRLVMAIGDFSISLAQTGIIPLREAARGNTPIPSNRLPNLRAHIDRLSFCFFMCCFHFSAPFQTIKKHHQWKSIQWRLLLSAHFSR